jgi:hypothetical protein
MYEKNRTAYYICLDYKMDLDLVKDLNVQPIMEVIEEPRTSKAPIKNVIPNSPLPTICLWRPYKN